jgi:hypothetical protein
MAVLISELPEALRQADAPVEVQDETGRVVGVFLPASIQLPFGVPPKGYQPPISDEEIERRRQKYKTGRPLSEIMKRLKGDTP